MWARYCTERARDSGTERRTRRLVEALSMLPAKILGLNRGTLRPGAVADITLIDPNLSWRVDANAFHSKSINSPFHGWTLQGRAVATIVGGRVKYRLG
jgi:dihydroorotase